MTLVKLSEERVFWQVCTLKGHRDWVNAVSFSPDGKFVVSGSDDTLVKIWNAETGAEVSSHGGWPRKVCLMFRRVSAGALPMWVRVE